MGEKFFIVGGAGFIGSHFCDQLLSDPNTAGVTLYDNFTSGREWHFAHHLSDPRFEVVRGEVADMELLTSSLIGHDTAIHLASNPDIAKAVTEPDIDFREGTALTNSVIECMRRAGVKTILYASGSGVYGDTGELSVAENYTPMRPISTYGASKLAGEALIASYSYMFDMRGYCFRFGNVVGARQTHGVGFDFIRRLLDDPTQLRILGDGSQLKSYIAVQDVVSAVLTAYRTSKLPFDIFNVATGDYITVTEIADLAQEVLEISGVRYDYTGGDRGWKGDVPIVRIEIGHIESLGWQCENSTREALRKSLVAMATEARRGLYE
jgi:UDP-glucose 4-epimerase